MNWNFLDNLIFKRYSVQLVFKQPAQFSWFHGPALSALMCRVTGRHPLGPDITLEPVESGVLDYKGNEHYNFGFTLFGNAVQQIERITEGLQREGASPRNPDDFPPFEVAYVNELPGEQFHTVDAGSGYNLRLVTPLRMERKEPLKGKRFFDTSFFDGERFLRQMYDRVFDLAKLSNNSFPDYVVPVVPEAIASDTTFLWIDAPFHGETKTCGGIIGTLHLTAKLNENWQRLLYIGQFTHAGRNTSMGFGSYMCKQVLQETPIVPARSAIDRIIDTSNLKEAFEHSKANAGAPGCDGICLEDFGSRLDKNIESLAQQIKKDSYKPEYLQGVIVPKSSGTGCRVLAIPSVADRVLQRAVCQVLAPSIDRLLEESSFAYRKGFSRKSAAYAINKAWEAGYRFILASDVNAFFDTVPWDRLESKLNALYSEQPLVKLLSKCLRQDVLYKGQLVKRTRGLAQGSAVSPVLANLYLDEFDEALGDCFKLIRYADDFVVVCKSKEEAEAALEKAKEALAKLSLEVKPEKTEIIDFDRGFQYLGYLFCRSLIVETHKGKTKINVGNDISESMIPPESWLTHVDFRKIRNINHAPAADVRKIESAKPFVDDGITVYLTDPCMYIRISGHTLVISKFDEPDAPQSIIPIKDVRAVVDYGKPGMSIFVLTELGRRGIPIYFCEHTGRIYLTVPGFSIQYDLWSEQSRFCTETQCVLGFVRAVVSAKIHNYNTMCRRQEWDNSAVRQLKAMEEKCGTCENVDALRGYEGRAAAVWFALIKEHLDPCWEFSGRMKHPPSDPVNAMLSFGYSCLYHHISTALHRCGLNPCIGWFHESRENYHALACDLQEEFRCMIDSLVLFLIHRNMVSPADFVMSDNDTFPCLMTKEFRRTFLMQLEEKLMAEFTPEGEARAINYRNFFVRQARQIETMCHDYTTEYQPLRIR